MAAWRPRIVGCMQKRATRVVRGLGAGASATLVAAASHSVAGGRMPSLVGITLALFAAVIVSIVLAGWGRSVGRLAASIVLSQLGFHLLFSTIGGAGEVVHGAHHTVVVTSAAQSMTHASGGMWAAHAIAAGFTIALLQFAGAAFAELRNTGRMLLARLRPRIFSVRPLDRAPRPAAESRAVPRLVRESIEAIGTRGPPVVRSA